MLSNVILVATATLPVLTVCLRKNMASFRFFLSPKVDLYYKVSNVGNGIDPTRSPDDLA